MGAPTLVQLLGGNSRLLVDSAIKVAPGLMLKENSFVPSDFPSRRRLAKLGRHFDPYIRKIHLHFQTGANSLTHAIIRQVIFMDNDCR